MFYGFNNLGIRRFFAKINETNIESIKLFEKLGYIKVNYSEVWKEIEYEFLTKINDEDDDNKKILIEKNKDIVKKNVENAIWTSYDC
jgi:RimJ/RimL family protein N-acetyltransferase